MGLDQSKGSGGHEAGKARLEDFDMVRMVGKGAFGRVWEVRKKDTGEVFAMKELNKHSVISQNLVEHTVTERNVMLMCDNPFIINLYFAFQSSEKLYFVLDFVSGGSLFELFAGFEKGYMEEEAARFYAAEILLGIEELHSKGIVYRDMKLENVLIGQDGHVVLTDFGLSAIVKDKGKVHSFSGTAIYIAPEVLSDNEGHGKSVDWWGFGVLLHVLLTGAPVFWSDNKKELFDMIKEAPVVIDDPILSPEAKDLLKALLTRDVNERLGCGPDGAEELKRHPFFHTTNWKQLMRKKYKPPVMPGRFELRSNSGPALAEDAPQAPLAYRGAAARVKDAVHFQNFSFAYNVVATAEADATAAALHEQAAETGAPGATKSEGDARINVVSPQEVLRETFTDDSVLLRKKKKRRSSKRYASLRLPSNFFNKNEEAKKSSRASASSIFAQPAPVAGASKAGGNRAAKSSMALMSEVDEKKLALLRQQARKGNRARQFIDVGNESMTLNLDAVSQPAKTKKKAPNSARYTSKPIISRQKDGTGKKGHRRTRSSGGTITLDVGGKEPTVSPRNAAEKRDHWVDSKTVDACHACGSGFSRLTSKHNCRRCGNVFCSKCAGKKRPLKELGYSSPVRHCKPCYRAAAP